MFLICFFLLFVSNVYAGDSDPLLPLIDQFNTRQSLEQTFAFSPLTPFETFTNNILDRNNDQKLPILFYSPVGNKEPIAYENERLLLIPVKQFDNPKEFIAALHNIADRVLLTYSAGASFKLFQMIYNKAAELTELTVDLLVLLEKHPNNSRLTRELNDLFQQWNYEIIDHDVKHLVEGSGFTEEEIHKKFMACKPIFAKEFATEKEELKKGNSNLTQLKSLWFLPFNYVLYHYAQSQASKKSSQKGDKTLQENDSTKYTADMLLKSFSDCSLDDDRKKLTKLKKEAAKITFFEQLYGKRRVIFVCLIAIPLCFLLYMKFMTQHCR
jgi:hypothetical protein